MLGLIKYAVVNASGAWMTLEASLAAARVVAYSYPGLHIERWTYPVLADGTHGAPHKQRLTGDLA